MPDSIVYYRVGPHHKHRARRGKYLTHDCAALLPRTNPSSLPTRLKSHWFGYCDKLEFDPTDRYVLGMEVDFEHRVPMT